MTDVLPVDVVSVQSQVVYGSVGNSIALPVLAGFELNVIGLPSLLPRRWRFSCAATCLSTQPAWPVTGYSPSRPSHGEGDGRSCSSRIAGRLPTRRRP